MKNKTSCCECGSDFPKRFGVSSATASELKGTALAIVQDGKGILAADESFPTIEKRFKQIGLASTEENRRKYRQILFSTSGIGEFLGGVILFDESIRHTTDDGVPFPQFLADQGILPGIKVDQGAKPLPGFPGEKHTLGLDGLREHLSEYRELGARFAKWRSVIAIDEGIPSEWAIDCNARGLALYAALCQEAGILPIVEPEVLMDGSHSIERCYEVTEATLKAVYRELACAGVLLEGTLLKPNMVLSGTECKKQAPTAEVAKRTVQCLKACVPPQVPGIVFLSGGQSEQLATEHLNLMNQSGQHPWRLSFSYGRALQVSALQAWGGKEKGISAGQNAFYHRAKLVSLAACGKYKPELEKEAA